MTSGADSAAAAERGTWTSSAEFLLTVVGFAVGLGNLWRFPGLAYENGGGAFLIPYMTCSLCFGLPCVYLEMAIGQFTRRGPIKAFHYFMPALQGVGWAMSMVSATVSVYYNVIVAWSGLYILKVIMGDYDNWGSCRNSYNTLYCESIKEDERCAAETNDTLKYFANGTCLLESLRPFHNGSLTAMSPAEEFFERWLLQKTDGIHDFGDVNWKMIACLFVVWALTAACLVKGVWLMGKVAYITSTVPYIIITALFFR